MQRFEQNCRSGLKLGMGHHAQGEFLRDQVTIVGLLGVEFKDQVKYLGVLVGISCASICTAASICTVPGSLFCASTEYNY